MTQSMIINVLKNVFWFCYPKSTVDEIDINLCEPLESPRFPRLSDSDSVIV